MRPPSGRESASGIPVQLPPLGIEQKNAVLTGYCILTCTWSMVFFFKIGTSTYIYLVVYAIYIYTGRAAARGAARPRAAAAARPAGSAALQCQAPAAASQRHQYAHNPRRWTKPRCSSSISMYGTHLTHHLSLCFVRGPPGGRRLAVAGLWPRPRSRAGLRGAAASH